MKKTVRTYVLGWLNPAGALAIRLRRKAAGCGEHGPFAAQVVDWKLLRRLEIPAVRGDQRQVVLYRVHGSQGVGGGATRDSRWIRSAQSTTARSTGTPEPVEAPFDERRSYGAGE